MSPHDQIPSDINPEKVVRALGRLGFRVSYKGGKGSHVKLTWTNEKSITVQRDLHKSAFRGLLKEIEDISGITWERLRDEL